MRRLVRQHRLADDVADRENRRLVRAALFVDHDEAALIDLDVRLLETGNLRVRPAPDRDQHPVEQLVLGFDLAFESHARAVRLGLDLHDLRLEQHVLHGLVHALCEDVHEIAIGARQQTWSHLHDGDRAAERGVDRSQLEADVAAANHQQRFRDVGEIERRGRVHHPRVVHLQYRRNRGQRTGC